MAVAPFQIVPEMQAVAEMYFNVRFIADAVLPRVITGTKEFQFKRWVVERNFTLPNTLVGRTSAPRRVEDKWTLDTAVCADHGLDHPLPIEDIMNARTGAGIDLRINAAQYLTWLVLLAREKRVADVVFNAANYAAGLSVTLAGPAQWTVIATSTPLNDIITGLSAPLLEPNKIVFGKDSWDAFRVHPQIVQAVRGGVRPANNAASEGIVFQQDIASLFSVDEVLVGDGRINLAKEGETPNIVRVFTDSVALLHINTTVKTVQDLIPTWGYTAQFGERIAGTIPAAMMGLHGGEFARVGETVLEKPIAPSAGYLIQDTNA